MLELLLSKSQNPWSVHDLKFKGEEYEGEEDEELEEEEEEEGEDSEEESEDEDVNEALNSLGDFDATGKSIDTW